MCYDVLFKVIVDMNVIEWNFWIWLGMGECVFLLVFFSCGKLLGIVWYKSMV